jgi:hypothetical protein
VASDEVEADRVGRPLRSELERVLARADFPGTVEVDFSRASFTNDYPYVLLTELQRADIEFRFPPATVNLDRFGESRCAESGEYPRLSLISGKDPQLVSGSRVLLRIVGITAAELDEYAALQDRFGDLLRAGTVKVDVDALSALRGVLFDDLQAVLSTPDAPATSLARHLAAGRQWGDVRIPSDQRQAFDRWVELEQREVIAYQALVLMPPSEPGEPTADAMTTC